MMVAMLVFFLRVLYEDEDEDEAVEVEGEEALEEDRRRFLLLRLLETCLEGDFLCFLFLFVSKKLSGSNSSGLNIQDIVPGRRKRRSSPMLVKVFESVRENLSRSTSQLNRPSLLVPIT